MINTETVFILGAGASIPYGYPSTPALKKHIISNSFKNKFEYILKDFKPENKKSNLILKMNNLVSKFSNVPIEYIDLFIAHSNSFLDVGKMAIIFSIFQYEINSSNPGKLRNGDDWFSFIYNRMIKGLEEPDSFLEFKNNKVSFITFNYDRSLEHFFYESLRNGFENATEEEIYKVVKSITILHVYGKIADLNWERGPEKKYPYLSDKNKKVQHIITIEDLNMLKNNIKLIYEREQDCSEIVDKISKAKRIFFLGFGYDDNNIEILGLNNLKTNPRIFGTAMGFVENEIKGIKKKLNEKLETKVPVELRNSRIRDVNCSTLLRDCIDIF